MSFHQTLLQSISKGPLKLVDVVWYLLYEKALWKNSAKRIRNLQQKVSLSEESRDKKMVSLSIPPYEGENPKIKKLVRYIEPIEDSLKAVLLHGSLASNDAISYSDLDALLVIKDETLQDQAKLAQTLERAHHAQYIFAEYDPLQHHGWFVLTEEMLKDFPETYFPHIILERSKSLIPQSKLEFDIAIGKKGEAEFQRPFFELAISLRRNLQKPLSDQNVYTIKSILSQFMLLPALFLQAIRQTGIDKKSSFELALKYFSKEEWKVMNEVSAIRENWSYTLNAWQEYLLTNPNYLLRKWGRRFAPKLKGDIKTQVEQLSAENMLSLIALMELKLKKRRG